MKDLNRVMRDSGMTDKYRFIFWIAKKYDINRVCCLKPTARAPYGLQIQRTGKTYLVIYAQSEIQKYYLNRSIKMQKLFWNDYKDYFEFNFPVCRGNYHDIQYVIYNYYDNLEQYADKEGVNILDRIYSANVKKLAVSSMLVKSVLDKMLMAWPEKFHDEIRRLDSFHDYKEYLMQLNRICISKEHGDYNSENVVKHNGRLLLMDFEFAKENQPIGLDRIDFLESIECGICEYDRGGLLKQKLCNDINRMIDGKKDYPRIRRWEYHFMIICFMVVKFLRLLKRENV